MTLTTVGLLGVLVAAAGSSSGEPVSAEQFLNILRAEYAKIHDFAFVFEGERRFVGPVSQDGKPKPPLGRFFQGTFQYRDDESYFLDMYKREGKADASSHTMMTLQKRDHQVALSPDYHGRRRRILHRQLNADEFYVASSPLEYVHITYLMAFRTTKDFDYEFEGWEQIDGHTCLRVLVDRNPGVTTTKPIRRYWFDVKRTMQPIRVHVLYDKKMSKSVENVVLTEVRSGSDAVWMPVSAEIKEFTWMGEYHDSPVIEETNYVVNGSLRVNQGLRDEIFDLERSQALGPNAVSPSRKQVDSRVRTDPAGVKEELDRRLAAANEQATMLDASKDAAAENAIATYAPYVLGCAGVVVLVSIGIIRMRRQ